jgi:hypothetical protein
MAARRLDLQPTVAHQEVMCNHKLHDSGDTGWPTSWLTGVCVGLLGVQATGGLVGAIAVIAGMAGWAAEKSRERTPKEAVLGHSDSDVG